MSARETFVQCSRFSVREITKPQIKVVQDFGKSIDLIVLPTAVSSVMCKLVLVTVFLMHSSQGLVLLLIFVCLFFSPLNSCDKYIYFYVKGKITANFIHTVYILKTLGLYFFSVKPGYISQPNV